MSTPMLSPDVLDEIEKVDLAIVELVARRCGLASGLPVDRWSRSTFPASFRVDDVVRLYCEGLGAPGELVARAVLNVSRAAQPAHI